MMTDNDNKWQQGTNPPMNNHSTSSSYPAISNGPATTYELYLGLPNPLVWTPNGPITYDLVAVPFSKADVQNGTGNFIGTGAKLDMLNSSAPKITGVNSNCSWCWSYCDDVYIVVLKRLCV